MQNLLPQQQSIQGQLNFTYPLVIKVMQWPAIGLFGVVSEVQIDLQVQIKLYNQSDIATTVPQWVDPILAFMLTSSLALQQIMFVKALILFKMYPQGEDICSHFHLFLFL